MIAKALEIRDEGTFIAALAVDMNPSRSGIDTDAWSRQRYLLRRVGYACDGEPNVILTRLDGGGSHPAEATNDPYAWDQRRVGRTFRIAHDYIIKNWHRLRDGDVVDVQYILGETKEPKRSERETVPL